MSMFEPLSLTKLSKKGADLHNHLSEGLSPRGGRASSGSMNRRPSSHLREIPANSIPETGGAEQESDGDSDNAEGAAG